MSQAVGQKRGRDEVVDERAERRLPKWTGAGLAGHVLVFSISITEDPRCSEDYAGARRVVELLPSQTLKHMHETIQAAFDWSKDFHLHEFRRVEEDESITIYVPWDELDDVKNNYLDSLDFDEQYPDLCHHRQRSPPEKHLSENSKKLFGCFREIGQSIDYEYDFGDGNMHKIVLEDVVERVEGRFYPRCTQARGLRPPEDGVVAERVRTIAQINDAIEER